MIEKGRKKGQERGREEGRKASFGEKENGREERKGEREEKGRRNGREGEREAGRQAGREEESPRKHRTSLPIQETKDQKEGLFLSLYLSRRYQSSYSFERGSSDSFMGAICPVFHCFVNRARLLGSTF